MNESLSERRFKCVYCSETGKLGSGKYDFLIVPRRCGRGGEKLVLSDGSIALLHRLCGNIMTYSNRCENLTPYSMARQMASNNDPNLSRSIGPLCATRDVTAVIPAGGRGLRLSPVTNFLQKVLLPVPPDYDPNIARTIRSLQEEGVKDIVCLIGYHRDQVRGYFESHDRTIRFIEDDPNNPSVVSSLLKAERSGFIRGEQLLVLNGDIYVSFDIATLLEVHTRNSADVTVVTSADYHLPVGVVWSKNGRLTKVVEKPGLSMLANSRKALGAYAGILLMRRRIMELLRTQANADDLLIFLAKHARSLKINVFEVPIDKWTDIGTFDAYAKINNMNMVQTVMV